MPIFGHLGNLCIRDYDEARNAVNAYEMLKNSNFFVSTYNGQVETWNTKPPLLLWFQAFFMKVLGVNEFAVRLPSAFSAFFTMVLLVLFSMKYIKDYWFGFIAVMVLITAEGYVNIHSSRTGDFDTLLTFFTTSYALMIFLYSQTKKINYLYLFYLFVCLATWTKGIGGLLMLPGVFVYLLLNSQVVELLKSKQFYIGFATFLVFGLGYYWIREIITPGFLEIIFQNEIGGHYFRTRNLHLEPFGYYFENFVTYRFTEWYVLAIIGVILSLVIKHEKLSSVLKFSGIISIGHLMVISNSNTKLDWYDLVNYPFLSMLVAGVIYYFFTWIREMEYAKKTLKINFLPYAFLALVFIGPYEKVIGRTYKPVENRFPWSKEYYKMSYYLRDAAYKDLHDLSGKRIFHKGYETHLVFYLNLIKEKGVDVKLTSFKWGKEKVQLGEEIIAHQPEVKKYIEETYETEILKDFNGIITYKLVAVK